MGPFFKQGPLKGISEGDIGIDIDIDLKYGPLFLRVL